MIEQEQVRAVVDAYVDSYRRNDKQACLDLFAPDAVWHDPVGEPPHVGHDGIGAFWDQAHSMAESITLEPKDVIVCANQAAMVFEIHVNLGGSTMVIDAVEVFVLGDDVRIAQLSAYWDMSRARTRA
jgi:steroid delta-isomerase